MQASVRSATGPPGGTARFVLGADPVLVHRGLRQMLAAAPLCQLSAEDRGNVQIVLAEVLNNIVEHAHLFAGAMEGGAIGPASGSQSQITVTLRLAEGDLHCLVDDTGAPLLGGIPAPGLLPDPQDLPEGGFGWHLIRCLCHGLAYQRLPGINRLSFAIPLAQSVTGAAIVAALPDMT